MLTRELLEALKARWVERRLPIVDALQRGLTDDEMDATTVPVGVMLPREARVLWGWHNGARKTDAHPVEAMGLAGLLYPFWSLQTAAQRYVEGRRMWDEIDPGELDYWWPAQWFWVTWEAGEVMIDCSVPAGSPSPVTHSHYQDRRPDLDFVEPRARSLGEVVSWWIDAFDAGIYGNGVGIQGLEYRWEELPPARNKTGLV
jgi:hypothetical protein